MNFDPVFFRSVQKVWVVLIVFIFLLPACGLESTPTPVALVPTDTPIPTDTPTPTDTPEPTATTEPTATAIVPVVNLITRPETEELVTRQSIAIQLELDPAVDIAEANWEFIAGSGTLDPTTGEAVVFTAPTEPDAVIIRVTGTTVDGVSFEEIRTFNIVSPTPTPLPPRPTRLPCDNINALPNNRTALPISSLLGEITQPEPCTIGLMAQQAIPVGGTAVDVPDEAFLWLFVYTPDGRYYPQCDDALEGRCGANYSQGIWSVITFLGRPNCMEHFALVLVVTDSAGNSFLTQTLKEWAEGNSYAGFNTGEVLEHNITEVDSIDVETAGQICP